MSTTQIPLAKLVEDFDLYPRQDVSSANVTRIRAAIQAGVSLPPPIVDRKSKRIVDGFHRCRAWRKELGDDGVIDVELRNYHDDVELFKAAVEANVGHGLPLEEIEKRRIALRLKELGSDDNAIAVVLHIPPTKVQKLTVRVATVTNENGVTRLEPLKRPHFHLQGKKMTEAQVQAAKSAPGTSYLLLVNQLRSALRERLADRSDERLIGALRGLATDIAVFVEGNTAAS